MLYRSDGSDRFSSTPLRKAIFDGDTYLLSVAALYSPPSNEGSYQFENQKMNDTICGSDSGLDHEQHCQSCYSGRSRLESQWETQNFDPPWSKN